MGLNTNSDALKPEFWAGSFDEMDTGVFSLIQNVDRKYEMEANNKAVHVPITPDAVSTAYTPGDTLTPGVLTQVTIPVEMTDSQRATFALNGDELARDPYDLIKAYGVPHMEALIKDVSTAINKKMCSVKYFLDGTSTFTEDTIIDAQNELNNRYVPQMGRKFIAASDDLAALQKIDAFQLVQNSGNSDIMDEGVIGRRLGLDFLMDNAITRHAPFDLVGAVNNVAGYAIGSTSMLVNGFNDDADLIRPGDIFTVAAVATKYTVISTVLTAGDTTTITFYPGLSTAAVNADAVTFISTRNAFILRPNAVAFASRPHPLMPMGDLGVNQNVIQYKGMPIRVSILHDGKLGCIVNFDVRWGQVIINEKRIQRIIR